MMSLTKSYLSAAPIAETAQDGAEAAMAQAFKVFDNASDSALKTFAHNQGFNLSKSVNYQKRVDEGYFRVVYPGIVMYTIWLDREGEVEALENLDKVFLSWMFGVAGYMMLDSNLDQGKENPAETLLCLSFIQEAERLLLGAFGCESADYELLSRFK
jgi:hypothetical protein